MNTAKTVTIICWSVSALVLIGLAVWFLTGSPLGIGGFALEFSTGPYEPAGTYSVPAASLDSLHVDWVSGDISVTPYDGEDITITEYAQRGLRDGEKLYYGTSGGLLIIKFHEGSVFRTMPSKKLEVLVPRKLCEDFKKLTLETTSGDVNASGFHAETVVAESTSGKLLLSDFSADNLRCETTSGDIEITSAETTKLGLSSTSGNVDVSDSRTDSIGCDTTSGDVTLSGTFDFLNLDTVSGDITFTSRALPRELTAETTSGSVSVTVPADTEVTVHHSSTSGKFFSEIPVIMQNRDARFDFSTTSGNVRIYAID